MKRALATLVLTALLMAAAPVQADDPTGPVVAPATGNYNAQATQPGEASAGPSSAHIATHPTNSDIRYSYVQVCDKGPRGYGCEGSLVCGAEGVLYTVTATYPNGETRSWQQCFDAEDAPEPTLTAGDVQRAFERIPLPKPELGTNPIDGATLVNFPTIFYTEAEPFSRDLTLLGQRVHLDITPSTFTWKVGDGDTMETDWAGRPYDRGVDPKRNPSRYVLWKFAKKGTVRTGVTVTWSATYSVNGGPTQTVPGTVSMSSDLVPLEVREAGQVLVG